MARWQIDLQGKGLRKVAVKNLVGKLKDTFGEGVSTSVKDATPPTSRAGRLSVAFDLINDAKSEMELLRDELQEWYDNLPEQFQGGSKGDQLQTAIDALTEIISDLDNVEGRDGDVNFPGMY